MLVKKEKTGRFMETRLTNFSECLAFGEDGEHEVANELIKKGVSVMPLYQFEPSHAPFILTKLEAITSPDLICFRSMAFMVEVKTKNQWVHFDGLTETGLDYKSFKQYQAIEQAASAQVFVFFNHKTQSPTGIYFCKLNAYTRFWDGRANGKKKYKPMVFYKQSVLNKLI